MDIRNGPFNNANALESADFSAAASATNVGQIGNVGNGNWVSVTLNSSAWANINKTGRTQFRIYFREFPDMPKHPLDMGESESFSGGAISFEQAWPLPALPTSRLEEQLTELFDLLQAPLCGYLTKLLGSLAEAEDVAQEAFLRLYWRLQTGEPVPNARAWLFHVAHNLAIDRQRREQRAEPLTADGWRQLGEQLADPAPQPEQTALEREKMARMQAALERLSPQERHCLYLRMEGLRYREIAEALGIGPPTVVTFLTRGIKKLTKDLQ